MFVTLARAAAAQHRLKGRQLVNGWTTPPHILPSSWLQACCSCTLPTAAAPPAPLPTPSPGCIWRGAHLPRPLHRQAGGGEEAAQERDGAPRPGERGRQRRGGDGIMQLQWSGFAAVLPMAPEMAACTAARASVVVAYNQHRFVDGCLAVCTGSMGLVIRLYSPHQPVCLPTPWPGPTSLAPPPFAPPPLPFLPPPPPSCARWTTSRPSATCWRRCGTTQWSSSTTPSRTRSTCTW